MEYPIQRLAQAAGTTSRTLRHYDSIGLVRPSRIGSNGYRYYDDRSLVRLQRVLLLRELGLGLDAIGTVLQAQDAGAHAGEPPSQTEARVLAQHRELLQSERRRIEAQIASIDRTITALRADGDEHSHTRGEALMAQNIFEGFDHTQYREEVEARWGAEAYAKSDRWWRELGAQAQQEWHQRVAELSSDWAAAAESGEGPRSEAAQLLAARHVEWLQSVPGTPARGGSQHSSEPEHGEPVGGQEQLKQYLLGLGEMYVADERFAANYGGARGAMFVRDALRHYVASHLD